MKPYVQMEMKKWSKRRHPSFFICNFNSCMYKMKGWAYPFDSRTLRKWSTKNIFCSCSHESTGDTKGTVDRQFEELIHLPKSVWSIDSRLLDSCHQQSSRHMCWDANICVSALCFPWVLGAWVSFSHIKGHLKSGSLKPNTI